MKIVQVLNAMITNHSKITNVLKNDKEYFFLYDKKYKWSINVDMHEKDEYFVHFYPTDDMTLERLAGFTNWGDFTQFITYSTSELKTKEAKETFSELYKLVANKVYGLDDIFDEIIGGDKN